MATTETLYAYAEYCIDCRYEGITPKPFWQWIVEGD